MTDMSSDESQLSALFDEDIQDDPYKSELKKKKMSRRNFLKKVAVGAIAATEAYKIINELFDKGNTTIGLSACKTYPHNPEPDPEPEPLLDNKRAKQIILDVINNVMTSKNIPENKYKINEDHRAVTTDGEFETDVGLSYVSDGKLVVCMEYLLDGEMTTGNKPKQMPISDTGRYKFLVIKQSYSSPVTTEEYINDQFTKMLNEINFD